MTNSKQSSVGDRIMNGLMVFAGIGATALIAGIIFFPTLIGLDEASMALTRSTTLLVCVVALGFVVWHFAIRRK